MKAICIKTKLKREMLEDVRQWFKTLNDRIDEVRESIENEDVLVESAFLDKQGDDYFLIYYMKANDIDHVYRVFNNSSLAIDKYYKECWKKYCEGRVVLEELLDIDRIESLCG